MGINAPSIRVGDILPTQNYGNIEILEYTNSTNIVVRFLDTASVKRTNSSQVKSGILKDDSIRLYGIQVGQEFQTSHSGICKVVEYVHAKRILVQFAASGKQKWTNSSQLLVGTASDRDECERVEIGTAYKNNEGFAATVKAVHLGSRFDVEFEDGTVKNVGIAALKSGRFLKGSCSYTQEEAVAAMKAVHGTRYDYSLVEFKGVKNKVKVRCYDHGVFEISFDNHVNSAHGAAPSGCRKCAIDAGARARTLDASLFVDQAKVIHGERYVYTLSDYKNRNTKISISCGVCGKSFKQTPEKHLTGQGCSLCNKAGFNTSKGGTLYVLKASGVTKIGITNKSATHRAKEINRTTDNKFVVAKEYKMHGTQCAYVESAFLRMLRAEYRNPDIKFDGYTECFVDLSSYNLIEMLDCLIGEL
jgi:protein-arginine kinase activator protein McsA